MQAAKLSHSVLVQHVFLSAALYPWCFLGYNHLFGFRHVRSYRESDYAFAGLIREIRNDYLCILGIECSELEQVVYTASTFSFLPNIYCTLFVPIFWRLNDDDDYTLSYIL